MYSCAVVFFGGEGVFYSSKNTQYSLIYLSRGTCDVFAQGNRADVASPGEEPGKRGHQHILLFMYRLSFIGSLRTDCRVATNTQPVWESPCEVIRVVCQGFPWEHILLCHMCLEDFIGRNSGQCSLCLFILKAVSEEDLMTREWDSTINYLSSAVTKPLTQLKLCLTGFIFTRHDNQRDLSMSHFNRFSPATLKQKPGCVYKHVCMSL